MVRPQLKLEVLFFNYAGRVKVSASRRNSQNISQQKDQQIRVSDSNFIWTVGMTYPLWSSSSTNCKLISSQSTRSSPSRSSTAWLTTPFWRPITSLRVPSSEQTSMTPLKANSCPQTLNLLGMPLGWRLPFKNTQVTW